MATRQLNLNTAQIAFDTVRTTVLPIKAEVTRQHNFYLSQYRSFRFWLILNMVAWFGVFGAGGFFTSVVIYNEMPFIMLALTLPLCFLGMVLMMLDVSKWINYKKDLLAKHYENSEKVLIPSLVKLYRKLSVQSVNINWACFSIYFLSALVIFFSFLLSWITNWANKEATVTFGNLYIDDDQNPIYFQIVLGCVGVSAAAFMYHVVTLTASQKRTMSIDSFYGFQIVNVDEIRTLRKNASKRNRWILIIVVVAILIIFFILYKIIRRQAVARTAQKVAKVV